MKNNLKRAFAAWVGLALFQAALRGEEIKPLVLRYAFAPGQTNAYRLEIESEGESGREAIAGNFVVSCRRVGSNLVGLTFRGQLRPKNSPRVFPLMGYRTGGAGSLFSYAWGSPFSNESRELVVDERGMVLRQTGDMALPIPLGQLTSSLVEKFPAEAASGWEEDGDAFVMDEPISQGPAHAFLNSSVRFQPMFFNPGQPGQGAPGVMTARQKTKMRVTGVTPETVSFEKTLSLESYLLTGTEPRVSASGTGKFVFDRATGWPRRVEMECKTVAVTEDFSRRSVLTLRWERLEGAEREAALAPAPAVTEKKTLSAEQVAKLLKRLNSDDSVEQQNAARELNDARVEKAEPEMLKAVSVLVNDTDQTVRHAALTFLANYGTAGQVPLLLKGLHDPEPGISATILHGLGRIKDSKSAAPLADFLASGQNDQQYYESPRANDTAEALIKIGPASEMPTLAVLKDKNIEARVQACLVLKQVGTKRSLAALKELTSYPNKKLSNAATEACVAIQGREDP